MVAVPGRTLVKGKEVLSGYCFEMVRDTSVPLSVVSIALLLGISRLGKHRNQGLGDARRAHPTKSSGPHTSAAAPKCSPEDVI